jgi:hypothetical protein
MLRALAADERSERKPSAGSSRFIKCLSHRFRSACARVSVGIVLNVDYHDVMVEVE